MKTFISLLSSIRFSLFNIVLAMILVVIGTLSQVHLGIAVVQEKIFGTFFIYWKPRYFHFAIPIFPGGYLVAGFFLLNLIASMIVDLKKILRKFGLLLIHLGIVFLLIGEILSGIFSKETILPIKMGQKINYSIEPKKSELAISSFPPSKDSLEITFQESLIESEALLSHVSLPFVLEVRKKFKNAQISFNEDNHSTSNISNRGLGPQLLINEIPIVFKDNELNYPAAWISLKDNKKEYLGTWLLSSAIEEQQSFDYNNFHYSMCIRPKRHYFPFCIELVEFIHENHPGTEIPKTFSSHINILSKEGQLLQRAYITMNHPLRYQGKTFYQAGFGEDEGESIFKVVENRFFFTPYLFSSLIISGLLYHFFYIFFWVKRKRS